MRLSDIMSHMGLAFYPQVGLALFLVAFVAIVFHTMSRKRDDEYDRTRHLPLDNDGGEYDRTSTMRGNAP